MATRIRRRWGRETFIIQRRRLISGGCYWGFKAGDNLGNVVLVKFLNRYLKFQTFLTTNQEFSDFGASGMILWSDFSYFSFLSRQRSRFVVNRLESVRGELAFMLLQRDLSSGMPDLALFVWKILPGKADDLGERTVVGLDLRRDMLALNKRGTEENECVGRTWYVVYGLLSAMT